MRKLLAYAGLAALISTSIAWADSGVKREILVDNDAVRVIRVTIPPGVTYQPPKARGDRVIVWITGNHTRRHALKIDGTARLPQDKGETVSRRAGDAMFRTASNHSITNLGQRAQVSDIIELKR